MNEPLRVLELFAGIGACSKALKRLNIPHEIVDAVEIDKYAIRSFNAIHNTNFEPQDITKWDKDIRIDLIMHGSPCQDFSIAGGQAGGDEGSGTRSSLMYETLRIVNKLHPKYVIWENVKNLLSKKHHHNFDAYIKSMNELGYVSSYQVLNAKDYGIPQNRERVFTVSIREDVWDRDYNNFNPFEFPQRMPLVRKLKDILEDEVDEKYFLSDKALNCFLSDGTGKYPRRERFLQNINRKNQNVGNSITTRAGSRPTDNFIKVRTANVKGYDEAKDGDSVDLQYPNSTTRRGRVGHEVSKTIMTGDGMGVVVKENNLKTKLCNQLIKEKIVSGGEIVNHSYTNSEQRDTLDKYIESKNGITPTLTTRPDILGVVVDESVKPSVAKNFEREKESIATSNKEIYQCECESAWQDNKVGIQISPTLRAGNSSTYGLSNNLRIRKLTPKECWRLMGFDDSDIEKAKAIGMSNAQLYKQAGNSIVVDVLVAILRRLLCQ